MATATENNDVDERPVLYLNIIIHDGTEIIKERIKRKVEDSTVLPKAIKPIVARHSANFASRKVKPSTIAQQMSAKMMKTIPKKLKSQGLSVEMKEVFREGPYVVLQLQVQHVDMIAMDKSMQKAGSSSRDKTPPPKPKQQQNDNQNNKSSTVISSLSIIKSSKADNSTNNNPNGVTKTTTTGGDNSNDNKEDGKSNDESTNTIAGALLQWTYNIIGTKNQTMIERGYLPNKVQDKLQKGMADMLSTTFQEKKLHAETCVLKETTQARFFFDKLQQIRKEEEARKESKRRLLSFSRSSSSFLKSSNNNSNNNGIASPTSATTILSCDDIDDDNKDNGF